MGDQALVQLTDEHGDAAHPGMVPEPVTGHADLSAAAPEQHGLIKERPLLNRNIQADRRQRRPRIRLDRAHCHLEADEARHLFTGQDLYPGVECL